MNAMYGKRRVVLQNKPTRLGNKRVVICGGEPVSYENGHRKGGGLYFPLGYWYEDNGLFYVDLQSHEQWYRHDITREMFAHQRWGGVTTKESLRKFVMNFWLRDGKA